MSQHSEFIPTGFKKLDNELDGGLMRKELIVIGGYTGSGKSYISGQMMFSAAREGYRCAYFSLEIASEVIVSRLVGSEANIKPSRIMAGLLTEAEHKTRVQAQGLLAAYNDMMYFVDDKYKLSEIERVVRTNSFDFIIIDFIQNVMEKGDEYEKLSNVALSLQKLAKEKDCCIVVVSQLSNSAHKDGSLEYKGSGSIATVCDLGMFLVRSEEQVDRMSLIIRKNRRGRSGVVLELQNLYPGGKILEL